MGRGRFVMSWLVSAANESLKWSMCDAKRLISGQHLINWPANCSAFDWWSLRRDARWLIRRQRHWGVIRRAPAKFPIHVSLCCLFFFIFWQSKSSFRGWAREGKMRKTFPSYQLPLISVACNCEWEMSQNVCDTCLLLACFFNAM